MLSVPFDQLKKRILDASEISAADFDEMIKEKLDKLSGFISKEGAAHIVANELGVKLFEADHALKIKNIVGGMRNVEVVGKVTAKYEVREFSNERRSGKVGNFMLADETGMIRIVLWNEQTGLMEKFSEGDVLKLKGAMVRENRGRFELHVNDYTKLDINPQGVSVAVQTRITEPSAAERKEIKDLSENDQNVDVLGTVVQVYDPAFFEVCPECGKRARPDGNEIKCPQHGAVTPAFSYVLNAFVDDGTGNIRCVFFRNQAQNFLGLDHDALLGYRNNLSGFEDVKTDMLGSIIKITGRMKKNVAFDRVELVAQRVERDPDPKDELERLGGEETPEKSAEEPMPETPAPEKPADATPPEEPAQPEKPAEEPAQATAPEETAKEEKLPTLDELEDELVSLDELDDIEEEKL